MSEPIVPEQLYTPKEAAERLRVSLRSVYRWLAASDLQAARAGACWRISEQDIQNFLRKGKQG